PDLPWCLIGDRGYDSDGLDGLLMTQYGIEHRDDRGESSGPREDAGRPAVATREAPLENRTALCLAPQLPPRGHPLGATRRELPGHGAARLCPDLAPGSYEIASSFGSRAGWQRRRAGGWRSNRPRAWPGGSRRVRRTP